MIFKKKKISLFSHSRCFIEFILYMNVENIHLNILVIMILKTRKEGEKNQLNNDLFFNKMGKLCLLLK